MLQSDDSIRCGRLLAGRLARCCVMGSIRKLLDCNGNAGDTSTKCGEVLEAAQLGLLGQGLVDNIINALLTNLEAANGRDPAAESSTRSAAILLTEGLQEQVQCPMFGSS